MITLKEAREAKGIKQVAVADALNISRQTYAKYEDKPEFMPLGKAKAACFFIGVNLNDICFDADSLA